MILSLDGGKRVGWCLWNPDGTEYDRGVMDFNWFIAGKGLYLSTGEEHLRFDNGILGNYPYIDKIIVEGFRHDPSVDQGGSMHEASQVEGAVKLLGAVTNVPVVVQYANILPVAMTFAKYPKPVTKTGKKKHLPDQDSAYLHGFYYMVGQGLRDPLPTP